MKPVLYYAYGSNMSMRRLRRRVPSAQPVGAAVLEGYGLAFHKRGVDGSAKCDAIESAAQGKSVHGVLFALDGAELHLLDLAEGAGFAYVRKTVVVASDDGLPIEAECYFAREVETGLKPYDWYLEHVVVGALEAGLPASYIDGLRNIESVMDPDEDRASRELSIYSD